MFPTRQLVENREVQETWKHNEKHKVHKFNEKLMGNIKIVIIFQEEINRLICS